MAKLEKDFGFTGTIANITGYRRKDLGDRIFLRSKGGPSAKIIQSDPKFDKTRKNNQEFGGRSSMSKWILKALSPLKPLSDYNIAGPLNKLLKPIQQMDTVSEIGKRNVELSKSPSLLEGFTLNKRNVFESVVRAPLSCTIEKDQLSAIIEIPLLIPGTNFFGVDSYPVYRWQVCLALVPDLFYREKDGYLPVNGFRELRCVSFTGEWLAVSSRSEPQRIELAISGAIAESCPCSIVLSAGVSFGTIRSAGPEQVKYAGSGKVLKVVGLFGE